MNALIVSEPGTSGVFTYVEALCHFLAAQGVRVHLAYSDRRGSDRLLVLVRFVESRGGLTANLGVGSGACPGDIPAFLRLLRLARLADPDIVHCHSSKAGVLGRSLALAGVRASYFYHPHAYYGMRPSRGAFGWIYDGVEAVLGRIGATVTVSSGERRFAAGRLGIPPERLRAIPNGVDTGRFRPADGAGRLALRRSLGVPADALVVGAMSRLSPQKDPATLYRAFAAACPGRPRMHLLHVGSGELEEEAGRLTRELGIGGRLTRLDYLGDPTAFYGAVDGFILTSTYEGLSLAALEALAADLPLILSRAPGNTDLLELPLSHAWGAEPGDVEGFARAIGLWHSSRLSPRPSNHRSVALEVFDAGNAHAAVLAQYRDPGRTGGPSAWFWRLPVLAWLLVIKCESTDSLSRANTQRLLFPPFHLVTGVSYGDFYEWNVVLRKVGHVFLYGILSLLAYLWARWEFRRGRPGTWSLRCAVIAVLGTVLVASLDEWHQTMIPSRTGTLTDVMLDTAAGLAAQVLVFLALGPLTAAPRSRPGEPTRPKRPGSRAVAKASPAKA